MTSRRRIKRSRKSPAVAVGIEAASDDFTRLTYRFRQRNVYPYLKRKGLRAVVLSRTAAMKSRAAPAARRSGVAYLTGSGHGSRDAFTGYHMQDIFHVGDSVSSGKMAHFLSCFTAQDLGPDFVRHGCRAYFGYADEFAWNGQTNPAPYLWCDAEIDRALADGETAEGALNRALKKFNQSINTLGLVRGKTAAAGMLMTIRNHLLGPSNDPRLGNPRARLRRVRARAMAPGRRRR